MFCFVLLALPALISAQMPTPTEMAENLFADVDVNMDDIAQRSEIDLYFERYDGNFDGRVSRHEFDLYIQNHYEYLAPHTHTLYDMFDVNGDGHLDSVDFDNLFSLSDGNGDGTVVRDEFVHYFATLFATLE